MVMFSDKQLEQLAKVIDDKLKPLKEGQERIEKKLDQSIEDNAGFINDAGIFFDEMRVKIVKRIEAIEDHLGIHKN